MRPEDLLDRLDDQPFKPFRIHISDGTVFDVPDAGVIMVGRSSVILPKRFFKDDEGRRIAEGWRKVSLLHIVQLSGLDESENGQVESPEQES